MKGIGRVLKKVLSVGIPKWILEDIEARLTHPYWRRKTISSINPTRITTAEVLGKSEKISSRRPFKRVNKKQVLQMLRKEGAKSILDVGCGVGNLVRYLESKGFELCGITNNAEEQRLANHHRIYFFDIQEDINESPLRDTTFDAVLSFDCLEHLEKPLKALRNINALLKPDGLFIAHIPPARWIECDYHLIVYTPRQFRWLLNLTGFDLERKDGR